MRIWLGLVPAIPYIAYPLHPCGDGEGFPRIMGGWGGRDERDGSDLRDKGFKGLRIKSESDFRRKGYKG